MKADTILALLLEELRDTPGLSGIVLGGSRGRGAATPTSDIDLGLYYDSENPIDLRHLRAIAARIDDEHRQDVLTDFGGWGPRINGGGWLVVQGMHVDFLYRDLRAVERSIIESRAGRVSIDYQPGHPHGFTTAMYMSEIALCRVLWDPAGEVQRLKALTTPYPRQLQEGIVRSFFWEIDFAIQNAAKAAGRGDVSYVAGCCFRAVSCLLQVLFALNTCYWMNEKGAVVLANVFPLVPTRLAERIGEIYTLLAPESANLKTALERLEVLRKETQALLIAQGLPA
ncbi:nucleotidyltransferase domain-containing protein [Ktedonobacter racemifer]|uniref:DNA polymerase beta domain protein region n=1 Tax=Ktedonobacter racemifer DSM 44963 TaxID=485913 RepID=D6TPK8_KTERA|nr:nucleotidyltransferase domain-containing protein [Ktedonobacter racemifer]EFH85622.1 DNA polymerase beta domain protein region [Ktedonobacter racemifer DSM 44963]